MITNAQLFKEYTSRDMLAIREIMYYLSETHALKVTLGEAVACVEPQLATPSHLINY